MHLGKLFDVGINKHGLVFLAEGKIVAVVFPFHCWPSQKLALASYVVRHFISKFDVIDGIDI